MLREQVQKTDHFFTLWCQLVDFLLILRNKFVGFEIFQVKINFGMITDSEMSGYIHEAHFPFLGQGC